MPAPFPHEYSSELTWIEGRRAGLHAAGLPEIVGGPPPQFDGSGVEWSPEELLLSSINLCMMTTFLSLLSKTTVRLEAYSGTIRATLDKTREGLRFTSITLRVDLRADDQAKASELLGVSKKYCIISNALNVPVTLETSAEVAGG